MDYESEEEVLSLLTLPFSAKVNVLNPAVLLRDFVRDDYCKAVERLFEFGLSVQLF